MIHAVSAGLYLFVSAKSRTGLMNIATIEMAASTIKGATCFNVIFFIFVSFLIVKSGVSQNDFYLQHNLSKRVILNQKLFQMAIVECCRAAEIYLRQVKRNGVGNVSQGLG